MTVRRPPDRLTRTTAALATNTVTTSLLGVAFWVVAGHRYSARQVGADSALLSSLLLLSTLTEMSFSTALPRVLPQVRRHRRRVVALCFLATAVAGALAAGAFAAVAPFVAPGLRDLLHSGGIIAGLVVGLVAFNIFAVQDAVLVAARRPAAVPIKNAVFGLTKLGLVIVLVGRVGGHGIFVAWLVATVLMVVPLGAFLFDRVLPHPIPEGSAHSRLPIGDHAALARYLVRDWAAGLLGQGAADLLPLLVLATLGRTVNGYFYVAFIAAAAVGMLCQTFSASLLVEAAHDEAALHHLTRQTLRRVVALVVPGVVLGVLVAPFTLGVFGHGYATHAGAVFRLLLVAVIPQTALAVSMSVERIRARADRVLRYQAVAAGVGLALAVPCMHLLGLAGIGWAWLVAQTVAATVALPSLRAARHALPPAPALEPAA